MISLELSMVQRNSEESARLAVQMEEFLSRGGQISTAPSIAAKPRPYGSGPEIANRKAPVPVGSKKSTMQRLRITPDIEEAKARAREKLRSGYDVEAIRVMANTMSQREVVTATGIHRKQLYLIAKENGFAFKESEHDGSSNLIAHRKDSAADARNVERIKAFRDIGVNRRQAAKRMGISTTLFYRLIREFDIDYPVTVRGVA